MEIRLRRFWMFTKEKQMKRKYSVNDLKKIIKSLDKRLDREWLSQQEDRKRKEADFHDEKHIELEKAEQSNAVDTYEAIFTNRKYYRAVEGASNYMETWIKSEAKGHIFLDYCCGIAGNSIKAALAGADLVIGIDISAHSLKVAEKRAIDAGVADRCVFILGDAENTLFPDGIIERGVCSGVLHHLDLKHALPELQRITSNGGKLMAGEALDYNPAIKLYRIFTPGIRTEWEKAHILSLKDIRLTKKFFSVDNMRFWHITAIAGPHLPSFLQPFLNRLDRVLERIPFIQLLAWMFTYEMVKSNKDG